MINISFEHFLIALVMLIAVAIGILDWINDTDYMRQCEDDRSGIGRIKRFLFYSFNWRFEAPEEWFERFCFYVKWLVVVAGFISIVYVVFFKIPIPFIDKPVCILKKW